MTDSLRAVTDSARVAQQWGQFKDYKASTAPPRQHDPPGHSAQVAMVVMDMCLTIAPIVLLAAIWSKLNEILVALKPKDGSSERKP
jgi:hypothetical protein